MFENGEEMNLTPDGRIDSEYMTQKVWIPAANSAKPVVIIFSILGVGLGWLTLSFLKGIGLGILLGVIAFMIAGGYSAFTCYKLVAAEIVAEELKQDKDKEKD